MDTCNHVDDGTGFGTCHFCGGDMVGMARDQRIADLERWQREACEVLRWLPDIGANALLEAERLLAEAGEVAGG